MLVYTKRIKSLHYWTLTHCTVALIIGHTRNCRWWMPKPRFPAIHVNCINRSLELREMDVGHSFITFLDVRLVKLSECHFRFQFHSSNFKFQAFSFHVCSILRFSCFWNTSSFHYFLNLKVFYQTLLKPLTVIY